jgi:hypothetical protein
MNEMDSQAEGGFTYVVEVLHPNGKRSQREVVHNLIPVEGLNHMMGVTFKSVGQVATWYIGLYEGNYTPISSVTAATIAAASTECTSYTPAQRVEFVEGSVVNGAVDNSASKAEFTFTAAKTVYGGFIGSASPRGSTSGVLISAVRFTTPKVLAIGDVLSVTAGNSLISA